MDKDNLKFANGSSIAVIAAFCMVIILLVTYVSVSISTKGTFSASEFSNDWDFRFWDYEYVESESNTGFKCYVNSSRKIAEIVYIVGTDNTGTYGVLTTIDPRRFTLSNGKISGFDLSGWNTNPKEASHSMYFNDGTLKSPNSWECKLTDSLTDSSNHMCDTYGQVAYVPLCRKYTSDSSDGNLIPSSTANADKVYCGNTGYYLYTLSELSEPSTCMRMPDGTTTSFAAGETGKTIAGVKKCDPENHAIVELTSCKPGTNTCYSHVVLARGSYEAKPYVANGSLTISFAPKGYDWSTFTDGDDPTCTSRWCYKCTRGNGYTAVSANPERIGKNGAEACPEGYSDDKKYETCVKECYYCQDGEERTLSGVFIDLDCSSPSVLAGTAYDEKRGDSYCANGGGTSPGTDPGTTPGTTTLKDCYSCYNGETLHDRLESCTGEWSETIPNCSGTTPGGTTTKKTCYKCTTDSTTPVSDEFESCTGEWSETTPTCSKTCKYCSNGEEKTNKNVPKLKNCSEFNSSYHEVDETLNCSGGGTTPGADPGTTPGGTTTKKTCYKCTNDAIVDGEFDSCDSNDGWFESEPRCCWTCNGINKTRVGVPSSQACTDFAGYTNTRDALTCEHKCWRCNGNTAEQVRVELGKECSVAGQEKGQTFVDKESDLNCSGGNTETPSVDVKAAASDTGTVQAMNEVAKIVDNIAEGKTTVGVDSSLKSKINNAIDNNKTIVVEVEKAVVDESNISSDANKVKETISSNEKVAAYYDVGVAIKVDNQKIGNVTELENKITVTVPIPANLPAVASGYAREYKIVRVHDGVTSEITPTVSGSNLSFKTDKFSTYAVVYQDVVKNGSSGNSSTSSSGSSQNNVNNPQTGSEMILIAWMIGFVAICYAIYYYTVVKVKD